MSSPFGLLTGKLSGVLTNLGHVHTMSAIKDFFMGNTSKDDAPEEIQALIGLFGLGDEIGFKRVLLTMTKQEQEIVTGFIEWHFLSHQDDGPLGGLIAWYKLNKWRTLVVKLDSPSAKVGEIKVETVTRPDKGKSGPTTTMTDTKIEYSETEAHTLKFLKKLVSLIRANKVVNNKDTPTETTDWLPGYTAAVRYCAATGMATVNESSILKWLDENLKKIPETALASPAKFRRWTTVTKEKTLQDRHAKKRHFLKRPFAAIGAFIDDIL